MELGDVEAPVAVPVPLDEDSEEEEEELPPELDEEDEEEPDGPLVEDAIFNFLCQVSSVAYRPGDRCYWIE